jgi:hypothetical protein
LEFRLCIPWWAGVASGIPVAFAAFCTATLARALVRLHHVTALGAGASQSDNMALSLAGMALLVVGLGLVTILGVYYLPIRLMAQAKRGSIVLDDQAISLTDRGRRERIPWSSVRRVRVIRYGGLATPARVVIEADDCTADISPWVCDRHRVLNEVVSRASLKKGHVSWLETRYVSR